MFYSKQLPPPYFYLIRRLLLFSVFWLTLSLARNPAHAQYPGSGGGGLPGSGGYGSGGSGGSAAWQTTVTSVGTVEATTPLGPEKAVWDTPDETRLCNQSISLGQTVTIKTKGTYSFTMRWLMPDGSAPPSGYGSPPKNVLVHKTGVLGWNGPGFTSSGAASNGLGSPPNDMFTPSVHTYLDAGDLYTVEDGSSGTITFSIDVSANVTSTLNVLSSNIVQVWRNMNVSSDNIVLGLHGTTLDPGGVDNILIGGFCQAGLYTTNTQASFQNYQWSINGNTFKSYDVTTNAQGQANGKAEVKYLTAADISSGSPSWSWITEGDGTVTVNADVYVSSSIYGFNPIKVVNGSITDKRKVTVVRPGYLCSPAPGSVNIWQDTSDPIAHFFNRDPVWLQARDPGIDWSGTVLSPQLFRPCGQGSWHFVQLITPNRSYVQKGITYVRKSNGNKGLDTEYPYGAMSKDPFNSNDGSGWRDDYSNHASNDSPGDLLNNDMTSITVGDTFETYMMYKPPNGTWVPLKRIAWQWAASVTLPASGSWADALGQVGNVTVTGDEPWYQHPTWNVVFYGTDPFLPQH